MEMKATNVLSERNGVELSIAAAAASDERAFGDLYQRYSRPVYNLVLRSVRDSQTAEDVCQEVWERIYRALPRLHDPAAFPTWLYRTASRICVDVARKRARLGPQTPLTEIACDDRSDPESVVLFRDRARLAWEALSVLPCRQHLALFLKDVEGHSYREIASILETSESAVETLMFRARRNFAGAYERLADGTADRCGHVARLIALAVDGEATVVQERGLRAHLDNCRACADDLRRLRRARLAHTLLPLLPVPEFLWRQVLRGIPHSGSAATSGATATGAAGAGAAGTSSIAQVTALVAINTKLAALVLTVTAVFTLGGFAANQPERTSSHAVVGPAAERHADSTSEQPVQTNQERAPLWSADGENVGLTGNGGLTGSSVLESDTTAYMRQSAAILSSVDSGQPSQAMTDQATPLLSVPPYTSVAPAVAIVDSDLVAIMSDALPATKLLAAVAPLARQATDGSLTICPISGLTTAPSVEELKGSAVETKETADASPAPIEPTVGPLQRPPVNVPLPSPSPPFLPSPGLPQP
jgi:RNA polymerase sigma-70 factor (ECF subfamily)